MVLCQGIIATLRLYLHILQYTCRGGFVSLHAALPLVKVKHLEFTLLLACCLLLLLRPLPCAGLPQLYGYMLVQRKKVLGGGAQPKKAKAA